MSAHNDPPQGELVGQTVIEVFCRMCSQHRLVRADVYLRPGPFGIPMRFPYVTPEVQARTVLPFVHAHVGPCLYVPPILMPGVRFSNN